MTLWRNAGFYILFIMKKAMIFIDGNNWYHNSKQIVDTKDIDFIKLSKFICDSLNLECVEIRYYNSIPDISENALKYHQHMKFLNRLEKQGIKVFTRKLQKASTQEILKEKSRIVELLDLCKVCRPLVKQNCLDCIGVITKKEKGIDVKIAVDMIRKCLIEKTCEVCVLISGDADFIPAMQTIKDTGKEAITACVSVGYSRELRDGRFRYFYLKRQDLNQKCMKDFNEIKNIDTDLAEQFKNSLADTKEGKIKRVD